MRFRTPLFILILGLVAPLWAQPPATKTVSQSDTYHGTEVSDPYRWLEDAASPEVKAWIKAQNAYTESQLGSFAEGKAISDRVGQLALTSSRQFSPQILSGRLFYMRETPPQPQAVLVAADWPQGEPKVLVDTNQGDASAILDFWPSPSGRYVAYGTATGGSELVTLKVVDTTEAKELPDRLPHAAGGTTPPSVLWDADEKGFVYVRLPLPEQVDESRLMFDASLYHHTLGEASTEDEPVFGQGLSSVAEYRLTASDDGKAAAVIVWFGDGSPERVYLRGPQGYKLVLGPEADIRSGGTWDGHRLLVVAHGNTPRGRVLAVDPDGQVETVVPEGDWAAQAVHPIHDGYLVTRVWGSEWRVDHHDRQGKLLRTLDLPAENSVRAIASASDSKSALISYQGWTNPDTWAVYDGNSGKLDQIFKVEPAADYSKVAVHHLEGISADQTRVPVTVLCLDSTTPDGNRPTILTAYGGFGICIGPRFLGPDLAWLEQGGVYAVANLRGGAEFGERWHQDGMLANKQNVFDDFYAASQALIAGGWTDTSHLGIMGGSNGGLLVGASLTQHPDQYRAVVGMVGLYDMLRSELWPNGTFNITEFGTVKEPEGFAWLFAYSPLHHVKPGTAYPAVMLETGENDPRVAPWQSRKFAAALQAATSSDHPVILLTRTNAGHGQGASFSQKVGRTAAALTFMAHELGLPMTASSRTY